MDRIKYKIFSQGIIGRRFIKNRLIRSATYEGGCRDGKVTDQMVALHRRLAEGGVGIDITGHAAVMPEGQIVPRQCCAYSDDCIKELAKIAEAVHSVNSGCLAVSQISHAGRINFPGHSPAPEAVGPSEVYSPLFKNTNRALSKKEIQEIVRRFVDAAVRVQNAGFDGVQLHAGHGWLLSSFLSPYFNRRNDEYGGSMTNRTRIIREIVEYTREKVGYDFLIMIKMNCDEFLGENNGVNIDNFHEVAKEVERAGVDAIEVSGGSWECLVRKEQELGFFPVVVSEARTNINRPEKQSYFQPYLENVDLSIPIVLVGGNRNVERLESILNQGKADFISMCRPLIREPDLPDRWMEGKGPAGAKCISCSACILSLLEEDQTVYCVQEQKKMTQEEVWEAILASPFTPK